MKKYSELNILPCLMLAGGIVGLLLRFAAQTLAVDPAGLPLLRHPLRICLWLLSLGLPALAALVIARTDKAGDYGTCFPPSAAGAAGHFALAVCIALTLALVPPKLSGTIGKVWLYLGIAAVLGLTWAGGCRLGTKPPCFVSHLTLCLFLAVHILSHYPAWSGVPDLMNYLFTLLGLIALLLYAYHRSACDTGLPGKRKLLMTGMTAVFLCTMALWDTRFWLLYGGGIFWVLTDLAGLWIPGKRAAG